LKRVGNRGCVLPANETNISIMFLCVKLASRLISNHIPRPTRSFDRRL
jgi:hypothetical protein